MGAAWDALASNEAAQQLTAVVLGILPERPSNPATLDAAVLDGFTAELHSVKVWATGDDFPKRGLRAVLRFRPRPGAAHARVAAWGLKAGEVWIAAFAMEPPVYTIDQEPEGLMVLAITVHQSVPPLPE